MKRYFAIVAVAVVVLHALPASANLLVPECPPGVTPETSGYYCQMPLKFYEEPFFRVVSLTTSAAVLAFLSLRIIRNRYVL